MNKRERYILLVCFISLAYADEELNSTVELPEITQHTAQEVNEKIATPEIQIKTTEQTNALLTRIPLLARFFTPQTKKTAKDLYDAVTQADLDTFTSLLTQNIPLTSYRDTDGKTFLTCIAEKKDAIPFLSALIEHKKISVLPTRSFFQSKNNTINIEEPLHEGKTFFILCAEHGNNECAQLLVNAYPSLSTVAVDNYGNSALFYAVVHENIPMIEFLKEQCSAEAWKLLLTHHNHYGNTVIHIAAQHPTLLPFVKEIIQQYPMLLKARNNEWNTPFQEAIKTHDKKLIDFLYDAICTHNSTLLGTRNYYGETPFFCAVESGNIELAERISKKNPSSTTITDKWGKTPFSLALEKWPEEHLALFLTPSILSENRNCLLEAVRNNTTSAQLLQQIIDSGASIATKDEQGNSALHIAATCKHPTAIQILLKKAPQLIDSANNEGDYPLHNALKQIAHANPSENLETEYAILKLLLEHNARIIDEKDAPLRNAEQKSLFEIVFQLPIEKKQKVTELILNHYKDTSTLAKVLNYPDATGYSPFLSLCEAVNEENNTDVLQLLTDAQLPYLEQQIRAKQVRSKLHSTHDASINGYTPLLLVAHKGNKRAYDILEKKGCDRTVHGHDGKNIAFYLITQAEALDPQGEKLFQLLVQHPELAHQRTTEGDTLLTVALTCHYSRIPLLVQSFPDLVHIPNNDGKTPMDIAIEHNNHTDITLMQQADPIAYKDRHLRYLMKAIAVGTVATVEACGIREININAIDPETGHTPLTWAAKNEKYLIVTTLLQMGADFRKQNAFGSTALHEAAKKNNTLIHSLLLKHVTPGDPIFSLADTQGRTPFILAATQKEDSYFIHTIQKMSADQRNTAFYDTRFPNNYSFIEYTIKNNRLSKLRYALQQTELNPEQRFRDGTLALHYLMTRTHPKHKKGSSYKKDANDLIIAIIQKQPACVNIPDKNGRTALRLATWAGNETIFDHLSLSNPTLLKEITQHKTTMRKKSILHDAAKSGNPYIIKTILNTAESVDINAQDYTGNTPLHNAAKAGHSEIVHLLLQKGAHIEIRNNDNQYAYQLAHDYKSISYLNEANRQLEHAKAEYTKLMDELKQVTTQNKQYAAALSKGAYTMVYTVPSMVQHPFDITGKSIAEIKGHIKVLTEVVTQEKIQYNNYSVIMAQFAEQERLHKQAFDTYIHTVPTPSAPPEDEDEHTAEMNNNVQYAPPFQYPTPRGDTSAYPTPGAPDFSGSPY